MEDLFKVQVSDYVPTQRSNIRCSIERFCSFLKTRGLSLKFQVQKPQLEIVDEFLTWMHDYRNVSDGTCIQSRHPLTVFLSGVSAENKEDLANLSGEVVERFFIEYAQKKGTATRQAMLRTLRAFSKFCLQRGYIVQDLGSALPTMRSYRLNKIPRGIEVEDALRVIASTNEDNPVSIRNHAILQILYTYGVRAAQVAALTLEDINWNQSQIRFPPLKQGKEILQPLTDEVGESLLNYLECVRPRTKYREVFMKLVAPYEPLARPSITHMVASRLKALGLKKPNSSANIFRHTFASRMLAQGESIKTIADMLGHVSIKTTFQYTKVDFSALAEVALEWPEVIS